jgi:hypothetical protein
MVLAVRDCVGGLVIRNTIEGPRLEWLLVLVLWACGSVVFRAQQVDAQTGSIVGVIVTSLDATPIPDAPIQAKNAATGVEFEAQSSRDGRYAVLNLPPGRYTLSAQYPPFFIPFSRDDVDVRSGQATRVEIALTDGQNTLGDGGSLFVKLTAEQPAPKGPAPRTRERKPDLSGLWLPNAAKPHGEFPQPQPWADEVARQRGETQWKDSPIARCLPSGLSFAGTFSMQRVVQTPTLIVIIDEGGDPPRHIYLDGRSHPKDPNPTFMGYSIGRWEGDALIVETVGFNDRVWLTFGGYPQTEKMRVVERFRRPDLGHLEVEMTFDDPGAFQKPFRFKRVSSLAPKDMDWLEYVCNENNKIK